MSSTQDWAPARVSLPAFASDSLAADIRSRRRGRRGVVIDGLDRLGLLGGLFVVLHALLEGLDTLRDVAHQVRNLAAAEQQQDHCDHHDPVPNAKRTHPATLQHGACSVLIESEPRLQSLALTRFLHANRNPLRLKTLQDRQPAQAFPESRPAGCQKQGPRPRQIAVGLTYYC